MKLRHFAALALAVGMTGASAFTSMAAGFVKTSEGTKYQWGDGSYCYNNWVQYKNHWFYFGNDQLMRTGWINPDGSWYYAADTGECQGGIMKINGNVYYFDSGSCKLYTGNRLYDGESYTFTENGTAPDSPYVYSEWDSNGHIIRGEQYSVSK